MTVSPHTRVTVSKVLFTSEVIFWSSQRTTSLAEFDIVNSFITFLCLWKSFSHIIYQLVISRRENSTLSKSLKHCFGMCFYFLLQMFPFPFLPFPSQQFQCIWHGFWGNSCTPYKLYNVGITNISSQTLYFWNTLPVGSTSGLLCREKHSQGDSTQKFGAELGMGGNRGLGLAQNGCKKNGLYFILV